MLVTYDEETGIRSRPMSVADRTGEADMWFSTAAPSDKVEEIRDNCEANVTFADGKHFVSLTGTASISNDRARIRQLYDKHWDAWFSGPDDPAIRLVHVKVKRGEYWDTSGLQGLKFLWQAGKAILSSDESERADKKTDTDQHAEVKVDQSGGCCG